MMTASTDKHQTSTLQAVWHIHRQKIEDKLYQQANHEDAK